MESFAKACPADLSHSSVRGMPSAAAAAGNRQGSVTRNTLVRVGKEGHPCATACSTGKKTCLDTLPS